MIVALAKVDIIMFVVVGLVTVVLFILWGTRVIKQKSTSVIRMTLVPENYDDWIMQFKAIIFNCDYSIRNDFSISDEITSLLFIKLSGMSYFDCLLVIRVPELSDSAIKTVTEKYSQFLRDYYGNESIRASEMVRLISIVCVDHANPIFDEFVNTNIGSWAKAVRLSVGIAFDRRIVYIANQEGGFEAYQIKKLRKDFLELMGETIKPLV